MKQKSFKAVLLAGGSGSRLYPLTLIASKQLQPVYDKPMIYYALSTLMLVGFREILLISTPEDIPRFQSLLGNGSRLGIAIDYLPQSKPLGIAHALILAEAYLEKHPVCFMLGDNLFYGPLDFLRKAIASFKTGAVIFGGPVHYPERYGVVEFDENRKILSLEEKPTHPRSSYAVPGLYLYDEYAPQYARNLSPSARGELEITDLNRLYLQREELSLSLLGRGVLWFDAGTPESLLETANFVYSIEKMQGLKVGCLEEVAIRKKFITTQQAFDQMISTIPRADLLEYLKKVWKEEKFC